jgi:transposase
MSYRELTMVEVKEVLRRMQAAHGLRKIARETGIDRKTVRRYLEAAAAVAVPTQGELTDEHVASVLQHVQVRESLATRSAERPLTAYRSRIEQWLNGESPLRLTKICTLLQREGVDVKYWTLHRYVQREFHWHIKTPTVRLPDPPPGQEAQVDFGRMGWIEVPEYEGRRRLWALIVTLSFSRYMFVWPTLWQTTEAVCEGLDAAWQFFDGMPVTLIPDNMRAMVARPDALAPRLTDAFADYAQARGLFIDPARVRRPKDKARVENQVPYVREAWFAGERFASVADAQVHARTWCAEQAGRRVHGTTRQVPREVYETVEKSAMHPAPATPFDVPRYVDAKVQADHHIQVDYALYSVPHRYLHQTVRVRIDRATVRVYAQGALIKAHPRVASGQRATDPNDYPIGKAEYAVRSMDALLTQARALGVHIGQYAERIVSGPLPWARMRQGYALLRLCHKFGAVRVDAVCERALEFDVIDVPRITRMLQQATVTPTPTEPGYAKVIPIPSRPPRFERALDHFQTRVGTPSKEVR